MSTNQVGISPRAEDRKLAALETNLQATLEASTAVDTDEDVAAAYILLADYLTELQNVPEALHNYENAARILSSSGDKKKLARIDLKIGRINLKIGASEYALGNFKRAAEIFDELRERKIEDDDIKAGIVTLGIQISLEALNEGNLDSAKEYYYRSWNHFLWPSWSAEKIYPLIAANLAELLARLGEKTFEYQECEDTIRFLEIRLSLKDEKKTEGAIRSRVDCLKILGKAYLGMGRDAQLEDQIETAYEWYTLALNAFELSNDEADRAKVLKKMGEVLLASAQLDQGEEYLQQSSEIVGRAKSESGEVEVWPFYHLDLQGVRITDIGTVISSQEQNKNAFLEVDIKNTGNLIWRKNRNISMAYEWKFGSGWVSSNFELKINDHLPPQSHMEVKGNVGLPTGSDMEYQLGCSIRKSCWEKPSASVNSNETVKYSSVDNTYSLLTGTTRETKKLIAPAVEKIMPEVVNPPSKAAHIPSIEPPVSMSVSLPPTQEPGPVTTARKVFISYNHKDKEIVDRIWSAFNDAGIPVILDRRSMKPGENIKIFIENAIKNADVTISIVSKNSLLSAWVGMETLNAFSAETYANKEFMPCYLDPNFLEISYTDKAIRQIDGEIKSLKKKVQKRFSRDAGIEDLEDELTRYRNLRTNIATIIKRLRESGCVDLSGSEFDHGIGTIIEYLKSGKKK